MKPIRSLRKAFGNFVRHEVAKGEQRQRAYVRQVVAEAAVKDFCDFRRAGAGVNANGHAQPVGGLVHRKKIGLRQGALPLYAAKEHAHRAVVARAFDLAHRSLHVPQRRDDNPAQAIAALFPGLCQVTVVGGADGHLQVDLHRQVTQ